MRELKYRIWDNHTKRYVTFVYETNKDCYLFIAPSGYVTAFNCYGEEIDFEDGRFVVQQYTGLQDRDGKDIYEGDIIQALPATRYGMGIDQGQYDYMLLQTPKIVLYNNGSYKLFDKIPHSYSEIVVNYYIDANMKIIGNIMQNPELLKQ